MKTIFKKLNKHRLKAALFMGALTCAQASQAQVLLDDYSNPSPWTQVGVNMHLGSGVMKFDNVHDAADNRAYRSLAPNIPALDVTWKAEFEFNYISGNVPAHSLFCLSAGTLNAYRESPTGNFTDEDMLDIALIEPYYGNGNQAMVTVLRKDGNNAPTSVASSINLRPYNTYYFRIEKVASIKYLLSVYSDQDRTVHVAGSPFCFTVGTSIGGFNTIQHGCIIQGASSRSLNGTIDNLYIENGYNPAGNIGGDQTITFGGDPTAFLCNTGDGDYSWISATDPDGTWTLIPGANSACYDAPAGLTQTTFYRRRRLICGTYFYSNTVTVNVLDCTEEEDYSNAANWIQVDNGVCVNCDPQNPQTVSFMNCADATSRRVYRNIPAQFANAIAWRANFEFTPTAVGQGGPGHVLLALTAGNQDPVSTNTPYTATNQDAIMVVWESNNHTNNSASFKLHGFAKNDAGPFTVSGDIDLSNFNQTYYISLERVNANWAMISAFTDPLRTQHLPGSPQCFQLPGDITGLTTMQHGTTTWGFNDRVLTATIDNTCLLLGPNQVNGGSISLSGFACLSGSAYISNVQLASNLGGWTYRWEKSDNCSGNWTTIPGAVAEFCYTGQLTTTTCFRRVAVSPCGLEMYSNTVTYQVYPQQTVSITDNLSKDNCEVTHELTANVNFNNNTSFLWSNGATTQSITVSNPTAATNYSVTVTSPCGNVSASFDVQPCFNPKEEFNPWGVPSWVTPNWSGNCTGLHCQFRVDDATMPVGSGPAYNASRLELRIYDRWGNNFFTQIEDISNYPLGTGFWNGILYWSGFIDGKPALNDIYTWTLDMYNNCGLHHERSTGAFEVVGTGKTDAEIDQPGAPVNSHVFPNPNNGTFNVVLDNGSSSEEASVKVYDQLGKEILTKSFKEKTDVDLSAFPKGIYMVQIIQGDSSSYEKVVVQ